MVKVTGPVMSLSSSPPLRKKRTPYGPTVVIPPPPVPEHIDVTAGETPPEPDCTGTYTLFGTYLGENTYARQPANDYLICYTGYENEWQIGDGLDPEETALTWGQTSPPPGEFYGWGPTSGTAILSAVIPATP